MLTQKEGRKCKRIKEGGMGMLVDWRVHGPFGSSPYLAPVNTFHSIFATQRLEQCLAHK